MVAAANRAAGDDAGIQRHLPVRAAIFQREDLAFLRADQHRIPMVRMDAHAARIQRGAADRRRHLGSVVGIEDDGVHA